MAAAKGNKNAVGNSGPTPYTDRKKAAQVRNLALDKILEILQQPMVKMKADDYDLYKQILVKLAGSILPKLQEVTGEDGSPLLDVQPIAKALMIMADKKYAEQTNVEPVLPSGNTGDEGLGEDALQEPQRIPV